MPTYTWANVGPTWQDFGSSHWYWITSSLEPVEVGITTDSSGSKTSLAISSSHGATVSVQASGSKTSSRTVALQVSVEEHLEVEQAKFGEFSQTVSVASSVNVEPERLGAAESREVDVSLVAQTEFARNINLEDSIVTTTVDVEGLKSAQDNTSDAVQVATGLFYGEKSTLGITSPTLVEVYAHLHVSVAGFGVTSTDTCAIPYAEGYKSSAGVGESVDTKVQVQVDSQPSFYAGSGEQNINVMTQASGYKGCVYDYFADISTDTQAEGSKSLFGLANANVQVFSSDISASKSCLSDHVDLNVHTAKSLDTGQLRTGEVSAAPVLVQASATGSVGLAGSVSLDILTKPSISGDKSIIASSSLVVQVLAITEPGTLRQGSATELNVSTALQVDSRKNSTAFFEDDISVISVVSDGVKNSPIQLSAIVGVSTHSLLADTSRSGQASSLVEVEDLVQSYSSRSSEAGAQTIAVSIGDLAFASGRLRDVSAVVLVSVAASAMEEAWYNLSTSVVVSLSAQGQARRSSGHVSNNVVVLDEYDYSHDRFGLTTQVLVGVDTDLISFSGRTSSPIDTSLVVTDFIVGEKQVSTSTTDFVNIILDVGTVRSHSSNIGFNNSIATSLVDGAKSIDYGTSVEVEVTGLALMEDAARFSYVEENITIPSDTTGYSARYFSLEDYDISVTEGVSVLGNRIGYLTPLVVESNLSMGDGSSYRYGYTDNIIEVEKDIENGYKHIDNQLLENDIEADIVDVKVYKSSQDIFYSDIQVHLLDTNGVVNHFTDVIFNVLVESEVIGPLLSASTSVVKQLNAISSFKFIKMGSSVSTEVPQEVMHKRVDKEIATLVSAERISK